MRNAIIRGISAGITITLAALVIWLTGEKIFQSGMMYGIQSYCMKPGATTTESYHEVHSLPQRKIDP